MRTCFFIMRECVTHMRLRGISVISGNWVNMTYLILLDISQAGFFPGIQHRHGKLLEPKRTQFHFD